jgi:hypothetical protein
MKVINFAEQNSIINQFMSELRDKNYQKNRLVFRHNVERIGELMAYELSKTLDYKLKTVTTPLGTLDIPVAHDERTDGKVSSYSMPKRIDLAVTTAVSFSTKSLRLIVWFGLLVTLLAVTGAVILVVKTLVCDDEVSGWPTLFVSMWFLAGILMMIMGIIAVYIAQIFDEVKHRPPYIIDETLNMK